MAITYIELTCAPHEKTLLSIKKIAYVRLLADENGGSVFSAMLDIAKERTPDIERNPEFTKCQKDFNELFEKPQGGLYDQRAFYKQISFLLDEFAFNNNLGVAEDDITHTNIVSTLKSVVQSARYDFRARDEKNL